MNFKILIYSDRKQTSSCLGFDEEWQGWEGIGKSIRKGLKSGMRKPLWQKMYLLSCLCL